jgi:hypothetical protein
VTVLRPEEVELAAEPAGISSKYVGHGVVEELLFSGAIERLRVRMAPDGPVPATPGRDLGAGALLEVSRTLPEQRQLPVQVGRRVAVGARRSHVLPTPISSFTIVSKDEAGTSQLRATPLLSTLAERMQARVKDVMSGDAPLPPGMPVLASGPGSAATVARLLEQGADQLLCLPSPAAVPKHVVILGSDAGATRGRALAVGASLLRHVPAEAIYLSVRPAATPEAERAAATRALLDARSAALADHGLDVRTELRFGDAVTEVLRELLAHEPAMLVVGIEAGGAAADTWLPALLEGSVQRPLLLVQVPPVGATAET